MMGDEPLAGGAIMEWFPPDPYNETFETLLAQASAEGQYLIEVTVYSGGGSGATTGSGNIGLAAQPIMNEEGGAGSDTGAGLTTLTLADQHWIGSPTDADKPNAFYEGRVTLPITIERTMPLLPEDSRRVQRQFGFIEIANGDGEFDTILRSYAIDGRQVRVLFGPYMGAYADFDVIADVVGVAFEIDDLSVRINVRDRTFNLDLPVQSTLFEGTGGAEGTDDVEGKPKPLLYGQCRNITPTLIDPVNLIYQLHDGAMEAVDAVYDQGAALTDSGTDVSGYSNLAALSVSAGNFATALDVSMFKLGSSPAGLITCDARGDNDPVYVDTIGKIASRILYTRSNVDPALVDEGSMIGAGAIGTTAGVYVSPNDNWTAADVMNLLFGSCAAWWGTGRDGRIRGGRLFDPANKAHVHDFDQYNVMTLEAVAAPVVRWRQRVGWQRNWTVQRGEDLAGSVTDERRQFLANEYRVVDAANTTVLSRHLNAVDPDPLPSLFDLEADAQALADLLNALYQVDRQMLAIMVKRLGYKITIGSVIRLTWPRLNLSSGRNFVVVGVRDDADDETSILTLWG